MYIICTDVTREYCKSAYVLYCLFDGRKIHLLSTIGRRADTAYTRRSFHLWDEIYPLPTDRPRKDFPLYLVERNAPSIGVTE